MSQAGLLDRLLSIVERAGIDYMITGSVAASHHGVPRATQDLDIVVELSADEVGELLRRIPEKDYYVSKEAAVDAVLRRTMFNVVDFDTGWKVDLIIRKERAFSREEFSRRSMGEVLGRPAFVASPEDVILSKLEWYRMTPSEQQLRDARGVLEVQAERLDFEYIDRWAEELGISELWRKVRTP